MKHLVSEIMDTLVYTCQDDQTLKEAVAILAEKEVGGLTIVDKDNHVMGFISDGDIMKAVAKQKTRSLYGGSYATMVLYDNESFDEKIEELKKRNVMELATRKVFCISPEQPIDEVARILSKEKIKKVPVVNNDGVLIGVVRRSSIMRYIFGKLFNE